MFAVGWLSKKIPTGYKGFRGWQKRYFTVTSRGITYSKSENGAPQGTIQLFEIAQVSYLADRRMGARFDIAMKNGRVYELHSQSKKESLMWIESINLAVQRAREALMDGEKKVTIVDETKYSQLQRGFFEAYYGLEMWHQGSVELTEHQESILQHIKETFETDVLVLTFLLSHVFDPDCGYFKYDFTMDDFKDALGEGEKKDGGYVLELPSKLALFDSMSIVDMVSELSQVVQHDCSPLIDLFQQDGIAIVDDLLNGDLPDGVPQDLSDLINTALAECRSQSRAEGVDLNHEQGLRNVVDVVNSAPQEFLRRLKTIFTSQNEDAHGLAVRVLWCIYFGSLSPRDALREFSKTLEVELPGKTSKAVKTTLIDIMLSEPKDVTKKLTNEELKINFFVKIKSEYMWDPLLLSLHQSDMDIRNLALKDIYTLLHENLTNIDSLRLTENWQKKFYYLATDMPKSKKSLEPVKTAYVFLINAVTVVHYVHFLETDEFAAIFNSSMAALHKFAGNTDEGQGVATSMLRALVTKLAANKNKFGRDQTTTPWKNLLKLSEIVKRYIFSTAWWASDPHFGVGVTNEELREMEELDGIDEAQKLVHAIEMRPTVIAEQQANVYKPAMLEQMARGSCVAADMPDEVDMEDEDMILNRARGVMETLWDDKDDQKLQHVGLHWTWVSPDDPQPCCDIVVVDSLMGLFKKLGCGTVDEESLGDVEKEELELMMKYKGISDFWSDAKDFLQTAKREDIINKLYTYRRLSFLCRSFIGQPGSAGRQHCINEFSNVIEKKKKKQARKHSSMCSVGSSSSMSNLLGRGMSSLELKTIPLIEEVDISSSVRQFMQAISAENSGVDLSKYTDVLEYHGCTNVLKLKQTETWKNDPDIPKKVILMINKKLASLS